MNYYKQIKNELINNEINRSDLTTYYNSKILTTELEKGIVKEIYG